MGLIEPAKKQTLHELFWGRGTKQKGNELLPGQDICHVEPGERIVH